MIKAYLKRPVCVERIDELGTGLLDKYEIHSLSGGMWHPHDEVGHSMLCRGYLEWGDWIATGADGSHWIIQNALYGQQYAELPVIPKDVAYVIKQAKKGDYKLGWVFHATYLGIWRVSVGNWIRTHAETFARAWLDGYVVEEEHD